MAILLWMVNLRLWHLGALTCVPVPPPLQGGLQSAGGGAQPGAPQADGRPGGASPAAGPDPPPAGALQISQRNSHFYNR